MMENCPDKRELENYASGGLRAADKVRLNRHVSKCRNCKELLLSQPSMLAGVATVAGGVLPGRARCPSEKQLLHYVNDKLSARAWTRVSGHLRVCARCRSFVEDERKLESSIGYHDSRNTTPRLRWRRNHSLSPLLARSLAAGAIMLVVALSVTSLYTERSLRFRYGPRYSAPVVLAVQDIKAGTIIRPEMVETRYLGRIRSSKGAFANDQDVVGKVAVLPISSEHIIMPSYVQERSAALGLAYTVPNGMRAVTVALDPIIGVAGFLKPGDHVDVLATFTVNQGSVTKTVLQNIELVATGSQVYQNKVDTSGKGEKAEVASNATLAVHPRDAEKLVTAESRGKLRLALRGVGDAAHVRTAGVTGSRLIGFVPPDVLKAAVSFLAASPQVVYQSDRTPILPAGMMGSPLPVPVVTPAPGPEVEVIRGTKVERVPVKS